MLRAEFDAACKECSKSYNPESVTDEMYATIEFVYVWYPTISDQNGKSEIAHLYITFGWAIIQDMYPRALEASRIENEIAEVRKSLTRLQENRVKIANGMASNAGEAKFVYGDA